MSILLQKRSLAALLAMLLLLSFFPAHAAESMSASGQVRVLLTEWSDSNTLDVGIWGAYLADGVFSFQRGARLRLYEMAGQVMMYYEGMSYQGGKELKLLRHQAAGAEENGLRLEGRLPLFEGDMFITAVDGKLQVVLHIGIEDYLKGVVPYEMSDTFPLEALKAQAIAARTYTLRALRSDRDYDVVDNTNDQVFRGTLEQQQQAHRAVQETAGIAIMYQGQPANAYYTASNGGQTESAYNSWGREHIAYLQIKDDPYDRDNPQAERRSVRLPKRITDADALPVWLSEVLQTEVAKGMANLGYNDLLENIGLDGVVGVNAHTPMYGEGSLLMTRLRFELNVSGRKQPQKESEGETALFASTDAAMPSPTATDTTSHHQELSALEALPAPVVVDLPLYPDMEQQLGLSINAKQNETVTVVEQTDAFLVQTGRYGHGVGMSQRGAEWMAAQHNMSYQDILQFYYPGTTLDKQVTMPAERHGLPSLFLATPGPRPTATPRPTLVPVHATPGPNQYMVMVTGIAQNSSLNLRAAPDINSDVLYQLFYGQRLLVKAKVNEEWLEVEADGLSGFVMQRFVTPE